MNGAAWPKWLALGVFAVALWARADAMAGVFYDDGLYLVLAKALAEGDGYRFLHLPGAPAAVHYPFLYPAVLSTLWRLWPEFPANLTLFHLLDAAALAVAAWGIASHARRWVAPRVAYVVVPAAFVAFPLLTIVGVHLSEPLFLALAAWSVVAAERDQPTHRHAVVAGVLAGLATLTRSLGLAFVVGIAVALLLRGRRRQAALATASGLLVAAPWFLWTAVHAGATDPRLVPNYGTYLEAVTQAGVVVPNVAVLGPLARLALPTLPGWAWYPLAALLLAAVVWGALASGKRVPALVVSLGVYLLSVAAWPYEQDRFLWILLPWLGLLGVVGGAAAWRRRGLRVPVGLLAIAVVFGYGQREAGSLLHREFAATAEGISMRFSVLAPAVVHATAADAVIAGEDEALLYLYTGRRAVPSYLFRLEGRDRVPLPTAEVAAYFCDAGVTHVATTGRGTPTAALVAALRRAAAPLVETVFAMTDGLALYRLTCPD